MAPHVAQRNPVSRWLSAVLLAAAAHLLAAAPAAAQCIMCYASAAGSGNRGIRTIQIGILILMIPTVAFIAGLVWMVVRRRNDRAALTHGPERDPKWEEELANLRVSPEPQSLSPRS
jgi:hypothetical protein